MVWGHSSVLVGAEMNWVIENKDEKTAAFETRKRAIEHQIEPGSEIEQLKAV